MSLNITASLTSIQRLSTIDFSKYDSILTAQAQNKNPTVPYDPTLDPIYKITSPGVKADIKTYFDGLMNQINSNTNPHKQYGFGVFRHDVGRLQYVAIPNFGSLRQFHALYDKTGSTLSQRLTNFGKADPTLMVGGNGPFFEEKVSPTPWPIIGNCYINGSLVTGPPNNYPLSDMSVGPGTRAIQWDNVRLLQFLVGEATGGPGAVDGFSSLPPIIWTGSLISPTDSGAGMYNASIGSAKLVSRHIAAYIQTPYMTSSTDILFLIASYGGSSNTDTDHEDLNYIFNSLQKLGFDYAVFLDSSSSVLLWDFTGVPGGQQIVADPNFYTTLHVLYSKDKDLGIGYGIK